MGENDIAGHIAALGQAITTDDEALAQKVALALLAGTLVNISRVASALEALAAQRPGP